MGESKNSKEGMAGEDFDLLCGDSKLLSTNICF